jgi:hypothetical protein
MPRTAGRPGERAASEVPQDVVLHIHECDRMFYELYGVSAKGADCNMCKSLLTLGFNLSYMSLPKLCIEHCERWRLPEEARVEECQAMAVRPLQVP